MNWLERLFLFTDEEIEQREKQGYYTFENGVAKGFLLGMAFCILLWVVIDFLIRLFKTLTL